MWSWYDLCHIFSSSVLCIFFDTFIFRNPTILSMTKRWCCRGDSRIARSSPSLLISIIKWMWFGITTYLGIDTLNLSGNILIIRSTNSPYCVNLFSGNSWIAPTIFENKCPRCGQPQLKWDSGLSGANCITCGGYHGSKSSWGDISESEVSCNACCSDFCGTTGWEKMGLIVVDYLHIKVLFQ